MADLKADFEAAVANSKKLSERPDNATLLKIYGLYKQATAGDNTEKKPGFGDMVTEIRAMPSAMQWWMRTMSALPPS